ncbi:AAA family ATPase [Mitsuaria sp. CC2]|uniref:AAA family ATPase n=1 Tax=Mitsuaria sp. CC2 TaxID=3029186 RepID=UPI003B8B883E
MRIQTLRIENFKGIKSREFSFETQFSVLIGENATGKTSVLDALAVALGSFMLGIDGVGSRGIQPSEIRIVDVDGQPRPQKPVVIEATGKLDGERVGPWRREIVSRNTTSSGARPISRLAQAKLIQSRKPAEEQQGRQVFPLIVYHGTGRLWAEHEKISYQRQIEGVERGYANALTAKSSSKEFLAWFKTQEDSLKKFENPLETAHFRAFKRTVLAMLPSERWHDIEWDYKNDALVGVFIDAEGQAHRLSYGQLSDGYRNLVGMVADIAYRCVQLNPHLGEKAVEDTPGVVLIDELDLHLHPNWQRTVVGDLKKAFPNLQFIATTHSPFIVQSLGDGELINLDREEPEPVPDQLPLNAIVTDVMGVENIRSDNFEERVKSAREKFQRIRSDNGELTLDDYAEISRAASDVLKSETNDPEYRAYLEESDKGDAP